MNVPEKMQLIKDFFDFEKPCPEKLENCEHLRNLYKERVEKILNESGCSQCRKNGIKNHFINILLGKYGGY